MELSYNELRKREVINVADGKSLGYLTDITLQFPSGVLSGIVVPERKLNWFLRLFNKTQLFISVENIIKIGNDVILVNLKCGDVCAENIAVGKKPPNKRPCPPNHCPPPCPPHSSANNCSSIQNAQNIFNGVREDDEDYRF